MHDVRRAFPRCYWCDRGQGIANPVSGEKYGYVHTLPGPLARLSIEKGWPFPKCTNSAVAIYLRIRDTYGQVAYMNAYEGIAHLLPRLTTQVKTHEPKVNRWR